MSNPFQEEDSPTLREYATAPIEDAERMVTRYGTLLDYMRRGARCEYAQWGVDVELDGPHALFPHLGWMRQLARLTAMSGRWRLESGDPAGALDDWLSGMRMARHTADNGTMIGGLVQMSIDSLMWKMMAANLHRFDREALTVLRERLDALPTPLGMAAAQAGEEAMLEWWGRELRAARTTGRRFGVEQLIEEAKLIVTGAGQMEAVAAALRQSDDPHGLAESWVEASGPWHDQVREVFNTPLSQRAEAALAFESRITASGNVGVIALMKTGLTPMVRTQAAYGAQGALLDAAIDWRLHGVADRVVDPITGEPFTRRVTDEGLVFESSWKSDFTGEPELLRFDAALATPLAP